MLSHLDNSVFEFLFVLETRAVRGVDQSSAPSFDVLRYEDCFQIKSLLGGSLTISATSDSLPVENLIYQTDESKVESIEQLQIEETLSQSYKREEISANLEPTISFTPTNYSLRFFSVEALSPLERELTATLTQVFTTVVDFIVYLQNWGVVSGKQLRQGAHSKKRATESLMRTSITTLKRHPRHTTP